MKLSKILCIISLVALMAACGKPTPVTWRDIAGTIPPQVSFVAAFNVSLQADSVLNDMWGNSDMPVLIDKALALCAEKPTHVVVVGQSGSPVIATWPLPDPGTASEITSKWSAVSLNSSEDSYMYVEGDASIVVSTTQVWVVASSAGDSAVSNLLSDAMNSTSATVTPLNTLICSRPTIAAAVIPSGDKYYAVEMAHDNGALRIDVSATDDDGNAEELTSDLGRLPVDDIRDLSPLSPFVAVAVDRGKMPVMLEHIAGVMTSLKAKIALRSVAPFFEDAEGAIVARISGATEGSPFLEVSVSVPFTSDDAARIAGDRIGRMTERYAPESQFSTSVGDKTLHISAVVANGLPTPMPSAPVPHNHPQTSDPQAVAYGLATLPGGVGVEGYAELNGTHARIAFDYDESTENTARVLTFVKRVIEAFL